MNNELQIFKNGEFGNIRTVLISNNPMFCLTDICRILEIKNSRDTKTRLNEKGVVTTDILTEGGIQKVDFINESNLYKIIFQSRKPQAEKFTDWVTDEVLPAIRKTGSYGVSVSNNDEVMKMLVQSQRYMLSMIQALNTKIDAISQVQDVQDVKTVSKQGKSKRNRKLLIQTLPGSVIKMVDTMLMSGEYTYSEVSKYLSSMGYSIGRYALSRYNKVVLRG